MITLICTADIAPGKLTEAVTFAHTVAAAVDKIAGHELQIAMPVGAKPFTLGWIVTEPDMATYAANNAELMADTGYIKLIETGAGRPGDGRTSDDRESEGSCGDRDHGPQGLLLFVLVSGGAGGFRKVKTPSGNP